VVGFVVYYTRAAAAADRTRWTAPSILRVAERGHIGRRSETDRGRHRYATTAPITGPVTRRPHFTDPTTGDGRVGRRGSPVACAEGGRPCGRGRQRGHRSRRGRAPAVRHHR